MTTTQIVPAITAEMSSLEAALALAAAGMHVFPVDHPDLAQCAGIGKGHDPKTCTQRGKHPAVAFTMAATTNPKMITTWFTGAPRNVGIHCGPSNLVVIDEDRKGELKRYADERQLEIPRTLVVTTGKGRHYYFTARDGHQVGNTAGAFTDYSIDVRGHNGYVVGPGSMHATGAVYTVLVQEPPAPIPDWILEAISRRTNGSHNVETFTGSLPPRGLAAVPDIIRGPRPDDSNGRRHTELVSYASSLRGRGVPLSEAELLFRAVWERCEQPPDCLTPLPWDEALGKLVDVYSRYPEGPSEEYRKAEGEAAGEFNGQAAGEPLDDSEAAIEAIKNRFPRLDWHELWADETVQEWIHDPLLPARRLVAMYSAPKIGKSLLMLEMAVTMSRGEEFLGHTPSKRYRVLYVDYENDPRGDVRTRLQDMDYGPDDLDHLDYLSFPTMAALNSPRGAAELLAAVKAYGSEVIVIDTVSRAIDGEENSNDTWLTFYLHTGLQLKRLGVAMIRLDHSGKDERRGMRGGSAKAGDVDAVWLLTKITDTKLRLECGDTRMRLDTKLLKITRSSEPLRHELEGADALTTPETKIVELIQLCDDDDLPAEANRDAVRDVAKRHGMKVATQLIREVVKRRKADPTLEVR